MAQEAKDELTQAGAGKQGEEEDFEAERMVRASLIPLPIGTEWLQAYNPVHIGSIRQAPSCL